MLKNAAGWGSHGYHGLPGSSNEQFWYRGEDAHCGDSPGWAGKPGVFPRDSEVQGFIASCGLSCWIAVSLSQPVVDGKPGKPSARQLVGALSFSFMALSTNITLLVDFLFSQCVPRVSLPFVSELWSCRAWLLFLLTFGAVQRLWLLLPVSVESGILCREQRLGTDALPPGKCSFFLNVCFVNYSA